MTNKNTLEQIQEENRKAIIMIDMADNLESKSYYDYELTLEKILIVLQAVLKKSYFCVNVGFESKTYFDSFREPIPVNIIWVDYILEGKMVMVSIPYDPTKLTLELQTEETQREIHKLLKAKEGSFCSFECSDTSKMETTDKLPEVGKRYKCIGDNGYYLTVTYIEEVIKGGDLAVGYSYNKNNFKCSTWIRLKDFFDCFEELPDQEPTTEESSTVDDYLTASYMAGLADAKIEARNKDNKVQEALEELKHKLDVSFDISKRSPLYYELYVKAQILVNALENVSKSTPLEKPSEDHIPDAKKKVKSTWKPISELPEEEALLLVRTVEGVEYARYNMSHKKFEGLNGGFYFDDFIIEYCTLTDFVNQQISLEERITKLEQKEGNYEKY